MLLLLLMQGGMCALTTSQLEAIKSEHCSNGTLSLTRVCNATWRPYPTGCPSDEEQYSCRSPARGSRCSVISQYNVTCLTPIRCRELQLPNNSALAVLNPTVLQTVKIKCNEGYEYIDSEGSGKGLEGEVDCLESGNFSSIRPAGFSCQPVDCGFYCRYCSDMSTAVELQVGTSDWKFKDRFGECCKTDPGSETKIKERLGSNIDKLQV